MRLGRLDRTTLSWAFYDWGNSAFATTVIAGFFPVFFKEYWFPEDAPATDSTFWLGVTVSVSGLIIAMMAPILGSIGDRGKSRRKFLFAMAGVGMAATAGFFLVAQGQWYLALAIYAVAMIGFEGSVVFYDSLLVGVAKDNEKEFVSALGYSMGYLGGGILFAFNVVMAQKPEWFGLADTSAAVRVSFLSVAVWWAVFTIPLALWVKEPHVANPAPGFTAVREGLRELWSTLREIRALKMVVLFLAAYWLYIDGVHTMVRMAVDYGLSLGFESTTLITALLITQFVGFPATLVVGKLGEKIGAKRAIYICIGVYCAVTIGGYFMTQPHHFYYLSVTIGLAQGGVQALSRALYIDLIPKNRAAQFFGFYNMLGKFAAVLGPAITGVVAKVTGSSRLSILALLILFVSGAALFSFLNVARGRADAAAFAERRA